MTIKYFIDTNIFLRTLIKEDQKTHEDCKKLLEAVRENQIRAVTSNLVLAEIAWTLASYYGFAKVELVKAIRSILNLKGLQLADSYQTVLALSLFEGAPVKYIDSVISSIKPIQAKKWCVVSYDKDFDKLGVTRKEPQEVITNIH